MLENFLKTLAPEKPVLLVDADEVLLFFVDALSEFLTDNDHELRFDSFALTGNIYRRGFNTPLAGENVTNLLDQFFMERTAHIKPVPDAAETLHRLSQNWTIAILTNIPTAYRTMRETNLASHGINFPVIANSGPKGQAVKAISAFTQSDIAFIDDLPHQHSSVKKYVPESHRIHHVADKRMAKLIGQAPDAHVRLDHWPSIERHLNDLHAK